MRQITDTLMMIRPASFRTNELTAVNNFFQQFTSIDPEKLNDHAREEFDAFVSKLRGAGVKVIVVDDDPLLDTPDSVFPNNWISFHDNGTVALYPMFAENRRRERREEVLFKIEEAGMRSDQVVDYSSAEDEGLFLEGTGSLLLDRVNRKAYCALSDRADEELVIEFCEDFEFTPVIFTANQSVDGQRLPIYHTNVMMCLGEGFCVICLSTIDDKAEKKAVIKSLKEDGKEIIDITEQQMNHFAGNMLQVQGADKKYTVMSQAAYDSLEQEQINSLLKHGGIISSELKIIETCGGGSARCMMAEVFLPVREA